MPKADPAKPSLFTFGCMSLGSDLGLLDEHIRVARMAMEAGIWFHASPTYHRGFTYMVLRMAFDEARHAVPPMVIKIRCGSAKLLRFEVEDVLRRLDIERVDLAQLVFTETGPDPLVNDLASGGPIADTLAALKKEGKVARFTPQCDRASSAKLLAPARAGAFDGFVLYLNPLQRDIDSDLWDHCQRSGTPLWALRTLAGALGDTQRREQIAVERPEDPKLAPAAAMAALAAELGCQDWTEFCMRYAVGVPGLVTTIGGTANAKHLQRFLDTSASAQPFTADQMMKIDDLRGH